MFADWGRRGRCGKYVVRNGVSLQLIVIGLDGPDTYSSCVSRFHARESYVEVISWRGSLSSRAERGGPILLGSMVFLSMRATLI